MKPKRNLIMTQFDNNMNETRRLSSICSSTKKQKCTTPKSILTNNVSTKFGSKGIKPKDRTFMFSQRRKTRKASKSKENRFYSRIAKRLNTTVNIASPLASDGFGDPKYFNFAKQFVNGGNSGVPRATMTNALLSPNLMSTLKAIKKRNNSLGIVNKYNTLNSSSGSIKDAYLNPVLANNESNERVNSEARQEQDQMYQKGVQSLDAGDPKQAIEYFTKGHISNKMVYIMLSIAYRRIQDYTEALKVLSKAISKHPKFSEAYVARGQIYLFLKKWDKAFIDFRKVMQLQKSIELSNRNKSAEVLPNSSTQDSKLILH